MSQKIKAVMLDSTGQQLNTNLGSLKDVNDSMVSKIDVRGGEIRDAIKDLKSTEYVKDVVTPVPGTLDVRSLVENQVAKVPTRIQDMTDYNTLYVYDKNELRTEINTVHTEAINAGTLATEATQKVNALDLKFENTKIKHGTESTKLAGEEINMDTLLTGVNLAPFFSGDKVDLSENTTIKNLITSIGDATYPAAGSIRYDIVSIKDSITNLKGGSTKTIKDLEVSVNGLQTSVSALTIAVEGVLADVADHEDRIDLLERALPEKQDKLSAGQGISSVDLAANVVKVDIGTYKKGLEFSGNELQVNGFVPIETQPLIANSGDALKIVILDKGFDSPAQRRNGYLYIYTGE